MKYCFALALLALTAFSSCKKKELKDIEKADKRLEGKWTVAEIKLHVTDTLGVLVMDTTYINQGALELKIASEAGNDVFNLAIFTGPCVQSELVGYFRSANAGDAIQGGDYTLWWDSDPEDMRIQFWGVSGSGSYHRGINLSYDGKGTSSQDMYYVVQNTAANTRSFYTWKLTK